MAKGCGSFSYFNVARLLSTACPRLLLDSPLYITSLRASATVQNDLRQYRTRFFFVLSLYFSPFSFFLSFFLAFFYRFGNISRAPFFPLGPSPNYRLGVPRRRVTIARVPLFTQSQNRIALRHQKVLRARLGTFEKLIPSALSFSIKYNITTNLRTRLGRTS